MFDWLWNWLFPEQKEYVPDIHVVETFVEGYKFKHAESLITENGRLPTLNEAIYLFKTGRISSEITEVWCESCYDNMYAWVVWSDGSRKKCYKTEFHQIVLVKSN